MLPVITQRITPWSYAYIDAWSHDHKSVVILELPV